MYQSSNKVTQKSRSHLVLAQRPVGQASACAGLQSRSTGSQETLTKCFLLLLLTLLLTTAATAQMASSTQNMRRVGARLACQCGCPDTVASCSMLGCSFSHPAKEKIAQMQASGVADSAIVTDFIKTYGQGIYRSEPNTFGWLVPYLALALGGVAVIWFVRRSRRPKPSLVMDPRPARYNDQIDQELQNLDK